VGGSGWNPNPGGDRSSSSPSPDEAGRSAERPYILIIEDNKADIYLMREAIESARLTADLEIFNDGEKACEYIDAVNADDFARTPTLAILDINLPKRHGGEVLRHMRSSPRFSNTQVVIVTSSDSERDRDAMTSLGISSYFCKPSDYDAFMTLGALLKELLDQRGPEPPL
jgi:CheY-like chemotaxis protein